MSQMHGWPSLEGWDGTKNSLHSAARIVGSVPRMLAEPHPKWWHVSLKVCEDGLYSDEMTHAALGDAALQVALNLRQHKLELMVGESLEIGFPLTGGESASTLGRKLNDALVDIGISVVLPEEIYAGDAPLSIDSEATERYRTAINAIAAAMNAFREQLDGEVSPVQLWPHHFDLAFEWFGTKMVAYQEAGQEKHSPAQLNFGFAPGDSNHAGAYFYSNPWPFEPSLTTHALPHGARWISEGFEGTLLPYVNLAGDELPGSKLGEYYSAVLELAEPTLRS